MELELVSWLAPAECVAAVSERVLEDTFVDRL